MIASNVNCSLELNITNYGNSNQTVLIDYGYGTTQSLFINPYCKYIVNSLNFWFIWTNNIYKVVPQSTPSDYLTTNLTSFYLNSKYALFLNSYVQKNASIIGLEIFCAEKGIINLRVKL